MADEIDLYDRLVAVATAKREALVGNDPDTLAELVTEMETITRGIERLEDERRGHACALAGGTDVTFRALVEYYEDADRARLEALRSRLLDLVETVRALNQTNTALVRQAIQVNEKWSRLLRSVLPATYAPTGAVLNPHLAGRAWSA